VRICRIVLESRSRAGTYGGMAATWVYVLSGARRIVYTVYYIGLMMQI
jgi:hypothetical protein